MRPLNWLTFLIILTLGKPSVDSDTVESDIFATNYELCGRNERLDRKTGFIVKNPNTKNPPGSWPWMVSLGEQQHYNKSSIVWTHFCGGTLVTRRHIVTAAHCVNDKKIKRGAIFVRAGDDHLKNIHDDDEVQISKVVSYKIHRDYHYPRRYYDVAVMTLEIPLNFTSAVRTVCLPSRSSLRHIEDHLSYTVTGWGSSLQSESGKKLYDTTVQVYSEAYCNQTHEGQRRSPHAVPHGFGSHIFCAGDAAGTEGVCHGDSGSPAVFFDAENTQYTLQGIVSGGLTCGTEDYPNIYIRVSDLAIFTWIYQSIGRPLSSTDTLHNYNLLLVEGVFEQTDQNCSIGEACRSKEYCPDIQAKYEERKNLGNSTTDQKKSRVIRDFLKSKVCNRDLRGFCCGKPSRIPIPQLDQSCHIYEPCMKAEACPFIKRKFHQLSSNATNSIEQINRVRLLKSKQCNEKQQAYCCPQLGSKLKVIKQIDQNCSADEKCETKHTCLFVKKKFIEIQKALSTEKTEIVNLLKSKVCNKQERAYCCPKPDPVSCVLSKWSEFTTCSASCRGGLRSRTREVLQKNANAVSLCEDLVHLTETESCEENPCPGDPGFFNSDSEAFDISNYPVCPRNHCSLPSSMGYEGTEQPVDECTKLDSFNILPIPVSENRKRGVHPTVCCPNQIPSVSGSATIRCGCSNLGPTFRPNKITVDLDVSVFNFCCSQLTPKSHLLNTYIEEYTFFNQQKDYTYEFENYEDYGDYDIVTEEVKDWCTLDRDIPKLSEEDCSTYKPYYSQVRCVNIKDCPSLQYFQNTSKFNTGVCGWDDEDKTIKICCPREVVEDRSNRLAVEPRYPGYQCTDRTNHCEKWRNNNGCRTDMDFFIGQHFSVSSGDMFHFMMSSCMESCQRCGSKGCRDEHSLCQDWAKRGLCITEPNVMAHTCRESCGVCGFLSKHDTVDQIVGENSYSDFKSSNYDCGRYIMDTQGMPVPPVVAGLSVSDIDGIIFCGSTLISDRWAISAAHCFDDDGSAVGQPFQMKTITIRHSTQGEEIIEYLKVYKHPKYTYPSLYNNIALLELERRVEFNREKYGDSPMCLDRSGQNEGKVATFQGYGVTINGTLGDFKEANLSVLSNTDCKDFLAFNTTDKPDIKAKIKRGLPNGITNDIFCAQGEYKESGFFDEMCKGDSGGPVFVEGENRRKKLAGVIAGGIGCGQGYPGWNIKVSAFIPWIECIIDHHKFSLSYGWNWTKEDIEEKCINSAK